MSNNKNRINTPNKQKITTIKCPKCGTQKETEFTLLLNWNTAYKCEKCQEIVSIECNYQNIIHNEQQPTLIAIYTIQTTQHLYNYKIEISTQPNTKPTTKENKPLKDQYFINLKPDWTKGF